MIKRNFGGSEVAFEPIITDNNVMVNATQMANHFNKRTNDFLKIDSTQKFIEAFCHSEDIRFGNEFSPDGKVVKIVKGDPSVSGTWMNRILAIKFAAWLNPTFEVWIYKTIDEIINGYSRSQDESIQRTIILKAQLREMELKPDKSGDDFENYIQLKQHLIHEQTVRANNTRRRFREIYRFLTNSFNNN